MRNVLNNPCREIIRELAAFLSTCFYLRSFARKSRWNFNKLHLARSGSSLRERTKTYESHEFPPSAGRFCRSFVPRFAAGMMYREDKHDVNIYLISKCYRRKSGFFFYAQCMRNVITRDVRYNSRLIINSSFFSRSVGPRRRI